MRMLVIRRLGSWLRIFPLFALGGFASYSDCSVAQLAAPQAISSSEKQPPFNATALPTQLPSGSCAVIPPDATFSATMLGHGQDGLVERRVALVVGNGAYKQIVDTSTERQLLNSRGDAISVSRALHALGFTVIGGVDLDKVASVECLSAFYRASQGAKAALFYFAGHGLSAGGNTYLLPIDAHVDTRTGLGTNFLRVNGNGGILQQLRQRAPSFLYLDACRNIPFGEGHALKEIDGENILNGDSHRGLVPLRDSDGGVSGLKDFYYAYSTFPGETASDDVDANGHSPFASAFLRHVAEPGLDVPRLLLEMSLDVGAATSGNQLPWGEGAIKANSDLYFNGVATLDEMIKGSDRLAVESDGLRTRGHRVEAITTALRGLPLGNSTNLSVHFGHAMASLYRAMQSRELITEDVPTACASVVAFSPDQKYVLTVIQAKSGKACETRSPDVDAPKIWDATTGRLIRKFDVSQLPADAQFERVLSAQFSTDGREVILEVRPKPEPLSQDKRFSDTSGMRMEPQLQWWDPATGKLLRLLPAIVTQPMAIKNFNENVVVTSCKTNGCGNIDVYGAKDGKLRRSFKDLLEPVTRLTEHATDAAGHPTHDRIKATALSTDGRLFFAISEENGLGGVWDVDTGQLMCPIDVSHATVQDHLYFDQNSFARVSASFDKDGHRLAFTRDNQIVRIYDVDKCKEIRTIAQNARAFLTSVSLSPDGRSLFTDQTNFQARLWSMSTGELLRTFVGHTDWVREAVYTKDSKLLATASDDGSVRIWNVDRNQTVHTIWPEPGFITEARYSHDGKQVVTVADGLLFMGETVPSVQLWTGGDLKPRTLADWRNNKIASVEFSGNDRLILGITREGVPQRLSLWDARTREPVVGISDPDHFSAATFVPGSTSVAVERDGKLELWIPDGNRVKLSNVYTFPEVPSNSPSSGERRPYSTSQTGKIVFSGDTKRLAIIDGAVSVLKFPQLEVIHQLQLPDNSLTDARFVPDGEHMLGVSRLATGLWDADSGKQVRSFMSSDGEQVLAAAVSPDGDRVATASWSDGASLRLWSTQTGELLAKQSADIAAGTGYINVLNDQGLIEGLEWATWSVSFNTDGTRVISAAGDGAARIWDIGPYGHDLIEAAEAVLSRAGEAIPVAGRMVFWEISPK